MSKLRLPLSRPTPTRLMSDEAGVAAVEFAFAMPIMLLLYFGVAEISAGVRFSQQFDLAAHTVGDLVSQLPVPTSCSGSSTCPATITDSEVAGIFAAANALIEPFSSTPLNLTISEVLLSNNSSNQLQATLDWTVANGGPSPKVYTCPTVALSPTYLTSSPLLPPTFTSIPSQLTGTGAQLGPVIVTEISYVYVPKLQLIAGLFGGSSGITFSRVTYSPVRNKYSNTTYSYLANHIVDAMTAATAHQSNCLPGGN
jgi:Flp pilus assembly protein TadG